MKLETITIDVAPMSVALLMGCGSFHSHQDGRWRYSPFGGETVYVNDPTADFPHRHDFGNGVAAAACLDPPMYARVHKDGTRGLNDWDQKRELTLNHLYAPKHAEERAQREWLADIFSA